ncbi:hypothetical protein CBW1004CProp1_gp3 [Phage CBW1004C-Prop1]|nr:hypothetical protein CBW1004CProp1_gp3 [Phage CBW1004C-Prop1]
MDKPNETPEIIYLIPDASEGVLSHVWCDDPAPGLGMDPEDAIEYRRADVTDAALAAAEARIAELESYNVGLATESHQQQERIVALEKALERIKARSDAYVDADAPMNPDSSVQVISDICAAALLKEKE